MVKSRFRRPALYRSLAARLRGPRRFIQVLAGPRQAGKTTLALQAIEDRDHPSHYASADEPALKDSAWIEAQWERARMLCRTPRRRSAILILDEIQKIPEWSEVVKRLWDEDSRRSTPLKVLLLGSAPLLVQRGPSDSLSGRFEVLRVSHWSFAEMRDAFGWNLDQYLFFGAYPGAATLIQSQHRWRRYIVDSLIETTLARDILLLSRIDKPALLRQLFLLGCRFSGQIFSYNKMLGQLHDAGNTTTLAHYLELLAGAGLMTGLPKFSGTIARQRGASPKLQVLNTALLTATSNLTFAGVRRDGELWGRLVETAVGAHLVNGTVGSPIDVFYWRDRGREVDFILARGRKLVAMEVKSGRRSTHLPGLLKFGEAHPSSIKLLVGADGIPVEEFLLTPVEHWLSG
ncbi:MAG TPA: ATP-binding protein [Vicinamibacteria bacterium]|nr:ATP-binding protein [Vicinamibacteria bacterium]